MPLQAIDGFQHLGKLHPADAVLLVYAGGGDHLAGFDGGIFLPKFEANGVLNHATADVVAALLGQQGSLQLGEGLGAGVDVGFQLLAAAAPPASRPPSVAPAVSTASPVQGRVPASAPTQS